jgi:hypothetical protein
MIAKRQIIAFFNCSMISLNLIVIRSPNPAHAITFYQLLAGSFAIEFLNFFAHNAFHFRNFFRGISGWIDG